MSYKDAEIARLKAALETKKRLQTENNKDAEIAKLRNALETKKKNEEFRTLERTREASLSSKVTSEASDLDDELARLTRELETKNLETKKKAEELRTLERSKDLRITSKTTSASSHLEDELARLTKELEEKKSLLREETVHMENIKEEKAAKRAEVIKRVVAEVDTKMNGKTLQDFYTLTAGQNVVSGAKTDQYGNADGRQFDLGREGAFNNFSVLVFGACWDLTEEKFMKDAGAALKSKGFRLKFVANEKDFIAHLFQHDVAWIISAHTEPSQEFLAAVLRFHEMGRGLALWADNDPYFVTVNAVLRYFKSQVQLKGDYEGKQILKYGSARKTGEFGKHLVTSGIQSLFEGITICNGVESGWFRPLATASDGQHCILYGDEQSGLGEGCGRILVDCGFTKLYHNWDTAGTGRYVRNVCVWLLGLDHKFTVMATLSVRL